MSFETLLVPRAGFSVEEPWTTPAACRPVRLRCATNGAVPRLVTSVAVWHDGECLSVLFSGADDRIVASYTEHDQPLWEEDVVEVFLAPERQTEYFELEVNPKGTTFDARIESPAGERSSMRTDLGWTCEGFVAAVRTVVESNGAITFDILLRVPFRSLGRVPLAGDTWRANFYRIDRHPRGDEYSAWQPTMKQPADFHVPAAFGTLRFA
ncbi:MAG TPA: carbohydrate-binding family 9-like protein [Thermoanaerobaculia bacterium]